MVDISQSTTISLGLLGGIFGALLWGAWSMAELHRDVEGLKRVAVVQMSSRWRCTPHMQQFARDLREFNQELSLYVPQVHCESDVDLLNFRNLGE